jgi:hypothetical protein
METGDQANPGADEDAPQDERADDAPEQNSMLLLVGHGEIFKNHEEDKKVIDTEGNFQDITGNELQSYLMPLPEVKNDGEPCGQRNIYRAPAQGRAKADSPSATVHAKIHQQHA